MHSDRTCTDAVTTLACLHLACTDAAYWYDNHVEDGEDPGTTYVNPGSRPYLKLTGVGLQTRYHPDANGQLKCAFIVKGKKDLQSAGSIKAKVSRYVLRIITHSTIFLLISANTKAVLPDRRSVVILALVR